MTELAIQSTPVPVPLPQVAVSVRPGTAEDIPFMDELQRKHTRQVGWMPTKQFEGKIAAGHVLVAWASRTCPEDTCGTPVPRIEERVGYLIGNDQYFKRDDVGIVYQINVAPVAQRGLIGATLLKAQFERSAWGCKLYCCWCAQDIAANHFWKAMGFVPLAFRTGGAASQSQFANRKSKIPRVHIFWQKRIRAGDEETPWWFPSQTSGGSIRSDRIVLPIPHGVQWDDEMPRVLPALSGSEGSGVEGPRDEETERRGDEVGKALAAPRARKSGKRADRQSQITNDQSTMSRAVGARGGMRVGPPPAAVRAEAEAVAAAPAEKPAKKKQAKNDPKLVAAARELRDRWLEAVNRGEFVALPEAKYEVARQLTASPAMPMLPAA